MFPRAYADAIVFNHSDLVGHYGNPIKLLKARISNTKSIEAFIEELASSLSEVEKTELSSDAQRYIDDKGALYLRLDKQEAFFGRIRLGRGDSIRVKIKLRSRKNLEEAINLYRCLNLL